MNRILVLLSLLMTASAARAALVDGWKVESVNVAESVARKADGSEIRFDRQAEVTAEFKLATLSAFGSPQTRLVKSAKITTPPAPDRNGLVQIEIESEREFACARRGSGMSLAVIAPHRAIARIAAAPGKYDLEINGARLGVLDLRDEQAGLVPDSGYAAQIEKLDDEAFAAAFGLGVDQPIQIASSTCSATVELAPDADYVAKWDFAGSSATDSDGTITIKPRQTGSARLTSRHVRFQCDGETVRALTASVRGEQAELELTAYPDGRTRADFVAPSRKRCAR